MDIDMDIVIVFDFDIDIIDIDIIDIDIDIVMDIVIDIDCAGSDLFASFAAWVRSSFSSSVDGRRLFSTPLVRQLTSPSSNRG